MTGLDSKVDQQDDNIVVRISRPVVLGLSLVLSLAIHFSIGFGLKSLSLKTPQTRPLVQNKIEWIELDEKTELSQKSLQKQIVRQTDVTPSENLKKKQADYLSESDQRVLEEKQAAVSGLTENRIAANKTNKTITTKTKTEEIAKTSPRKNDSLHPTTKSLLPEAEYEDVDGPELPAREKGLSDSRDLIVPIDPRSIGVSTIGEHLDESIPIGNFTALNTDRFKFYSFFARAEVLVRDRWVKYVKSILYGSTSARLRSGNYRTQVEIILDSEGNFLKGMIHETSGVSSIDTAPVLAFREAAKIPHPPREMLKEDRTIHLNYVFNVDYTPLLGRRSSPGDESSNR